MRIYLAVTSALFFLLAIVHALRAFEERNLTRDPWFLIITIVALALGIWALRLFLKARSTPPTNA
jgi:predicted cation transporter